MNAEKAREIQELEATVAMLNFYLVDASLAALGF
jgi:hypothetical protein